MTVRSAIAMLLAIAMNVHAKKATRLMLMDQPVMTLMNVSREVMPVLKTVAIPLAGTLAAARLDTLWDQMA